jgi:hypothetical protein
VKYHQMAHFFFKNVNFGKKKFKNSFSYHQNFHPI